MTSKHLKAGVSASHWYHPVAWWRKTSCLHIMAAAVVYCRSSWPFAFTIYWHSHSVCHAYTDRNYRISADKLRNQPRDI